MNGKEAYLHEIFGAVQGEGPFVGFRQIFARFCGCNLCCRFCDTPESRNRLVTARIEQTNGGRDFEEVANPISAYQFHDFVSGLDSLPQHSLAVTGGEPLLQADFLATALPLVRGRLPIYLETNGTLPKALERVLFHVDFLSMDMKLPSAAGANPCFDLHREFLLMATEAQRETGSPNSIFVKIVITGDTEESELERAFRLTGRVDPSIEVVLQPATPVAEEVLPPAPGQVLSWQTLGLAHCEKVRVIPQMHRLMGQM